MNGMRNLKWPISIFKGLKKYNYRTRELRCDEEKNQENQPSAQHLPPSFAHPGQMAQDLDPSPTPYGADEPSQNPSFNPPAPDLDDSFDFDL